MPRRPLTDLQQAILDTIWTIGPCTADQLREAIRPSHPLKDSSVRTLLRRLESYGYLTHQVDGKVFRYEALIPRRKLAARAVRQIIDRLCAGSVEQFLIGMVDEQVLTAGELRDLARKVKAR